MDETETKAEEPAEVTLIGMLSQLWEGHGQNAIRVTLIITEQRKILIEGTTWIKQGFLDVDDAPPDKDKQAKLRVSPDATFKLDTRPSMFG